MEQCLAQFDGFFHHMTVQNRARLTMKGTEPRLQKFERFEKEPKQPGWLFPLRKAGLARFAEQGFPTINDEDWRFTNVGPITKLPFKPVFEAYRDGISSDRVAAFTFGRLPAHRLVFVDGHYVAELSDPGRAAEGIIITNLAAALISHSTLLEKHLGSLSQREDNAFAALNTAYFQDGAFLYLPAGKIVEKPVHLLFISTGKDAGATSHPRNLIIAEKGSQLTVLESYVSIADAAYFTNGVTELIVADGAI